MNKPRKFWKSHGNLFYKSLYNTIVYSGPEFRYGIAHGLYRIFLLFPAAFEFKMMDIHTFIQQPIACRLMSK